MESIAKSHKYISRKPGTNGYIYEYPKDQPRNVSRIQAKITIAKRTKLITGIEPERNITASRIDEWLNKYKTMSSQGKLRCTALGNANIHIIDKTRTHLYSTLGVGRSNVAISHKAQYLPFVDSVLIHGKLSEVSRNNGHITYGVIAQAEYTDSKTRKKTKTAIELAIAYDKTSRKYLLSFSDIAIKKAILADNPLYEPLRGGLLERPSLGSLAASFADNPATHKSHPTISIIPLTPQMSTPKYTFTATLHGITEGNRIAKSAAFTDAIIRAAQGTFRYTPSAHSTTGNNCAVPSASDNTRPLGSVTMHIHNFDMQKALKAARTMAFSLDVPVRSKDYGEHFVYRAHEDLCDRHAAYFASMLRELYDAIIARFGLPNVTIVTKSDLTWKGQTLYSPETGMPIKQSDWDKFVKDLETFLNRKVTGCAKRIVLTADALGRILDRMLKTNSLAAVQAQQLAALKYKGKTFDWISDDVKHMKSTFGDIPRSQQARIQAAIDCCAQRITNETDATRNDIKQIFVDSIRERKSTSQVSQALFDKLVGHNRNYHRIADTETSTAMNVAFVREEVQQADEGERVYFKRVEVIDDNTCEYCKGMNGTIAVWSETPITGDIADPVATVALWDGKEWGSKDDPGMGAFHPWCRGVWLRYRGEMRKSNSNHDNIGQFADKPGGNADRSKQAAKRMFPSEKWTRIEKNVFVAAGRKPRNKQQRKIFDSDVNMAKILAKRGHTVCLLPETGGGKHPDAIVDGELTEFKRVTGGVNAISHRFRESLKQAQNVFLQIDVDVNCRRAQEILHGVLVSTTNHGTVYVYLAHTNRLYHWNMDALK